MPTPTQPAIPNDDPYDGWGDYKAEMAAEQAARAEAKRKAAQAAPLPAAPKLYLASTSSAAAGPNPQPAAPQPAPALGAALDRKLKGQYPALASRSALFTAARATPADPDLALAGMAAHAEYGLEYEGPRLNVHDKAVWEAAIDIARTSSLPAGTPMPMPLRSLGKRMGLNSLSQDQALWTWERLQRLARARVTFNSPAGGRVSGPLLGRVDKIDGKTFVAFDPTIAAHLLGSDSQFRIDAKRRRLMASGLAQWLHDYLSTHDAAMAVDLRYLRGLCGYGGHKRRFPADLDAAMGEVAEKAPDLVESHQIHRIGGDGDHWTLEVVKGSEKPAFTRKARPKRSGGSPAKPNRKGGVAL